MEAGITGCFRAGGGDAAGLCSELKGFGIPRERRESHRLGTPESPALAQKPLLPWEQLGAGPGRVGAVWAEHSHTWD